LGLNHFFGVALCENMPSLRAKAQIDIPQLPANNLESFLGRFSSITRRCDHALKTFVAPFGAE
ncbi:MAG: hypothetical protein VXZ25_08240, partial [Pseudomonadota bacterium]|nr:hypothetical protein [Pseudomonadota bacterium]